MRSKALPLFIAMRGISYSFLVHLPSWHDELRVCKEKQIKLLLMFQNVIRVEKTSNSESVSFTVWRLEIFCWGDMKINLIKGRSLESVWSLLKMILQQDLNQQPSVPKADRPFGNTDRWWTVFRSLQRSWLMNIISKWQYMYQIEYGLMCPYKVRREQYMIN